MVQVAIPSQPMSIFKSDEKAFAMSVPPPPAWPRAQVWCLVMHLPVVVLLAETGSAKLGPRKVQAAAGHKPCPAHVLLSKQLRPVCAEES